jgi:hypothetical protein
MPLIDIRPNGLLGRGEFLPDTSKVYLASIRGLCENTNVHRLASEALWWLVIDEADVRLDLDLDTLRALSDLRYISAIKADAINVQKTAAHGVTREALESL